MTNGRPTSLNIADCVKKFEPPCELALPVNPCLTTEKVSTPVGRFNVKPLTSNLKPLNGLSTPLTSSDTIQDLGSGNHPEILEIISQAQNCTHSDKVSSIQSINTNDAKISSKSEIDPIITNISLTMTANMMNHKTLSHCNSAVLEFDPILSKTATLSLSSEIPTDVPAHLDSALQHPVFESKSASQIVSPTVNQTPENNVQINDLFAARIESLVNSELFFSSNHVSSVPNNLKIKF